MPDTDFDVIIVGAGLSGIAAACVLQRQCPGKRVAILEARDAIGGTWDLFRYPGVRSDSDMQTLGYSFRPWVGAKAIADGPSILAYVRDTAAAHGVDRLIRYGHRITHAAWSTSDATWTLDAQTAAGGQRLTCHFVFMCSGYYDTAAGYTPDWPGVADFAGRIVHPQQWPTDLDYAGKHVVIIGSGATAVTLAPAMARTAAHVTMLQRSPSYVVTRPSEDAIANWLHRHLPAPLAHAITRWKNVLLGQYFYGYARRKPQATRQKILALIKRQLGPDYDVARHFTPSYDPWDQRLCLVPDGDLFRAIRSGTMSVVTDHIDRFTQTGLALRSGAMLDADIVVAATGLQLKLMGGMTIAVDGTPVDLARTLTYKGMMYSDVPNLASAFGYTNASWTLKCELTCAYVCRLLRHMDAVGLVSCTPRQRDPALVTEPAIGLTSGYIQRAAGSLPQQGSRKPWKLHQNYALDLVAFRFGTLEDGVMEFAAPPPAHAA